MADNIFQIGDLVQFTQDHPNLEEIGAVLGYTKGGKAIITSVREENGQRFYKVRSGLTERSNVPESHLYPLEQEVKAKVENKLNEDQKNKAFKDIGARVRGSRKEVRAYDKVMMSDLTELELDAVTAQKFVVKDKVYPEVNIAEERSRGVSSGAAYLKVKIRESCGVKPANNKDKRAAFVKFIDKLTTDLYDCYSVEDVQKKMESYKLWNIQEVIGYLINPYFLNLSEEEKARAEQLAVLKFGSSLRYIIPKLIEEICGKRLSNLIFRKSDAAYDTFREAKAFEAITEEESASFNAKHQEMLQNQLKTFENQLEEYKTADTEGLKKLMNNWNLPTYKKDPEGFRRLAIGIYEKKVANVKAGIGVIPERYKAKPDDWSWFEQPKERKEAVKSGEPTINTWTPLSHITRTRGLLIDENFVNAAASTDESKNPITSIFGFKSVQYGNALKDEEAKQHVKHFLGGMADLAEILDFDITAMNKLGGLSIAFASRGKKGASAHYERDRKIINLSNRNGDGSLCHEYGHYLDNMLASIGKTDETLSFASTIKEVKYGYYQTRQVSSIDHPKVDEAMRNLMNFIKKGKEGITGKVALRFFPKDTNFKTFYVKGTNQSITAEPLETMEATIEKYASMSGFFTSFAFKYPDYQRDMIGALVKHFDLPYYDLMIQPTTSQYYYYSSMMSSKYWIEDWELFARAFETYVFDKLADSERKSTYLVSGEYFNTEIYTKTGDVTYVYPFGTEREYLVGLYDNLIMAMKDAYSLGSFVPFTDKRMDEYLKLEDKNEEFEKVESGVKVESKPNTEVKDVEIIENNETKASFDEVVEPEKPSVTEVVEMVSQDTYKEKDKTTSMNTDVLSLRHAKRWDILPNSWIKVQKVTPIKLSDNLENPEYKKLFASYINKDNLRENMGGVFIDDDVIVATDAHKILVLPNKVTNEKGLLDIFGYFVGKNKYINARFPDYKQVLPAKYPFVHEVDLLKLKTYNQAVILGRYSNPQIKKITYLFGNNDKIAFNGEFLNEVCTTFLQLGHKKAYFSFDSASRGVIIAPTKEAAQTPNEYVGKEIIALCMPLYLYGDNESYLGASDIDFNTEIQVYYSFIDNEIHNADGSVAIFNPNADSEENGYVTEDEYAVLKAITQTKKAKLVPILEYVRVLNKELVAFNLEDSLTIKNVNLPDGLYELVSKAFKPADASQNIDNYPNLIKYDENFEAKGSIDAEFWAELVDEAKEFTGDDELRPQYTGLGVLRNESNTIVFATNAFVMYKRIIKDSMFMLSDVILGNPYLLHKVLKLSSRVMQVSTNKTLVVFEDSRIRFVNKTIDARLPQYDSVIKPNTDYVVDFNKNTLVTALADAKKINSRGNILFDKPERREGEVNSPLYVSKKDVRKWQNIEKDAEKLKYGISYNVKEESSNNMGKSIAIIMPIYREDEPNYLGFDINYLKTIANLTDGNTLSLKSTLEGGLMFILDLPPIKASGREPKPIRVEKPVEMPKPMVEMPKLEAPKKVEEPKTSKQDLLDTIEALEILADSGNEDAKDTIEALKMLL